MTSTQQDFPIAFAEQVNHPSDVEIYVEWLDNSTEFPTLTSSAVHATYLDGDSWELLQRKEVIEDDEDRHILVPLEEDDEWLNTEFEKEVLYSEVTEKNAAELQPKQHTVKSFCWVNKDKLKDLSTTTTTEEENDDDDYYEDEENNELLEVLSKPNNRRRANRLSRLRRFRGGLKTTALDNNNYVEGYYKVVATKGLMKPAATDINGKVRTRGGGDHHARSDKKTSLGLCSKYNHHKMNKYTFKYLHAVPKASSARDNSEFSVHSDIILK